MAKSRAMRSVRSTRNRSKKNKSRRYNPKRKIVGGLDQLVNNNGWNLIHPILKFKEVSKNIPNSQYLNMDVIINAKELLNGTKKNNASAVHEVDGKVIAHTNDMDSNNNVYENTIVKVDGKKLLPFVEPKQFYDNEGYVYYRGTANDWKLAPTWASW